MIHVLLADDHPAMRIGLRVLLEQAGTIQVAQEVGTGEEALVQVEALRPDVAVLDCKLPGMSGVAVAMAMRQRGLPTRVLALSAYSDQHFVRGMVAAGAAGYLMKEEAPGAIAEAVRAVARGEAWFSPAARAVLEATPRHDEAARAALSQRELEVLQRVALGETNCQIALALAISEKTVEKHLAALFAKLGAASRVDVAVRATRAGLLEQASSLSLFPG